MKRILLSLLLLSGCGDELSAGFVDAGPQVDLACNPLIGDDCLTPFPSSFHEIADPTTATGVRVHVAPDYLPISNSKIQLRPDRLNKNDGFSPGTPFFAYFEQRVDGTNLPWYTDPTQSLSPTSQVQIIDMATGNRVKLFAEIDANAQPYDRQALLIHPLERLKPGGHYVVALVGLTDPTGKAIIPANFKALRDGETLPAAVQPLAARYQDIFSALASAGVPRASLSLAWDVHIRSEESITGRMTTMRDNAVALADSGALSYTVDSSMDYPDNPHLMREVFVTMQAPNYLAGTGRADEMVFDDAGKPKQNGTVGFTVTIEIPKCAATATTPLPYVIFGHGLFGTAKDYLEMGVLQQYADSLCMIIMGTDFEGLAEPDLSTLVNIILPDMNHLSVVTDRLQQGQVNFQVMTRLFADKVKDDPALAVNGHPISDGKVVYYIGGSLGGIEGGVFMGLSKDVPRGVLNVAGCDWDLMLFRSFAFLPVQEVMSVVYPDKIDWQFIIAAQQTEFDFVDPLNYASHLIKDPLPGTPAKKILVQESVGDALVPNISTAMFAREIGLQGIELEYPIAGVTEVAGPLDSAVTQWDIKPMPLPPTTDTALGNDNGAHGGIQQIPQLIDQIVMFLKPDGMVVGTCGGPCIYPRH